MVRMVFVMLPILMGGCANLNSIFRADTYSNRHSALGTNQFIDAKQRVVTNQVRDNINMDIEIPVTRPDPSDPTRTITRNEYRVERYVHVCAERSPDAIQAIAASGSIDITTPKVGGSGALSVAEQVASIALRTQLTQAQAELLYRVCEAHGNGAISDHEVHRHLRRFQNTMVALMAIEQVTGAVTGANAALSTNAAAITGQAIQAAERALKDAREAEERAQDAVTKATEDLAERKVALQATEAKIAGHSETTPAATITADQQQLAAIRREVAALTARVETLTSALASRASDTQRQAEFLSKAQSGSASASGTASTTPGTNNSGGNTPDIATAVMSIVDTALTQQATTFEICHDSLTSETAAAVGPRASNPQVMTFCMRYLEEARNQAHAYEMAKLGVPVVQSSSAVTPPATQPQTPRTGGTQPSVGGRTLIWEPRQRR